MAENNRTAFQKALTDAALLRYQGILDADTEPAELSDGCRERIEQLTKRTQRKTWRLVDTTAKRILIAAVLMLLLAATAVAAVPALREGLIRFIVHNNGVAFTFEFTQEEIDRAPKEIETYYVPSYVPKGYVPTDHAFTAVSVDYLYYNDLGYCMAYTQDVLAQFAIDPKATDGIPIHHVVNSENADVEYRVVQGYEVMLVHHYLTDMGKNIDNTVAIWTDHQYFYEIDCPNLEIAELDKIIASLTIVEPS